MGLRCACCELLYKHSNLKTVARDREIDYWIQNRIAIINEKYGNGAN